MAGNMNGHVALREFIEAIINEKERRRDDLRIEDHRRIDTAIQFLTEKFEASVADVDRAARLLFTQNSEHFDKLNHAHEEAQRILGTYALLRDFNELKSKVELRLSETDSRLKYLEENRANHEQRLKNIEDVQPTVVGRLKDLETMNAAREERLRGMEAIEAGRSSLSKDEKERQSRVIQRFQILAVVGAIIGVATGVLSYFK